MSSQAFLWLNLGFIALMAVLFYVGRAKVKDPSRLKLRGSNSAKNAVVPQGFRGPSREVERESGFENVKSLNVIFMYNGHTWDAHEVLGVPAGARLEVVKAAYAQALQKATGDSRSFIETAYRAILEKTG